MALEYKVLYPVKYHAEHIARGIRPDGRKFLEFRPFLLNVGQIATADGSALAKIGNSTAVCGIKAELAQPKLGEPNRGFLIPSVELTPICSSKFRPGPPCAQAQMTSQLLLDIIENSKCFDITQLSIFPEKLVWVLYCDIYCTNYEGSLVDVCLASLIAALKNITLPYVEYDIETGTTTINLENRKSLNVTNIPIASTFITFEEKTLLADPTTDEENVASTLVTVCISEGKICMLHKSGGHFVPKDQLLTMMSEALKHFHVSLEVFDKEFPS